MRVVLLSFGFVHYDIPLANALSKLEDVMFIVPKNKLEQFIQILEENVNVKPYHQPRFRNPMNLITVYKIIKQIKNFKPDVIHLLGGHHPWFNFILPLLRRKYALVTTIHDVKVHIGDKYSEKIPTFIYRLAIKYTGQLIVHGKKLKELTSAEFNKPANSIHVIPHGEYSLYGKFLKHRVKENGHLVLFFGRIWEYKGLEYLIKAQPFISKEVPDVKIVIAGTGENFEKYRKMMIHKEKFIIHNEYITNERVAELFIKCNLVVLPYIEASQSGVLFLAYAFKKPVVATDVGSIPEVVDDGETGYIVPPRNTKKLAEAIVDLLKDKEKRKKMGENAYRKTKEEHSWDSIVVEIIEVYKKALCDRSKSYY